MTRWDKNGYHTAWLADAQRLTDAATPDALDRDVPSCPGWTLRDLVGHIAQVTLNIGRRAASPETPPAESKGAQDYRIGEDVLAEYRDAVRKTRTSLESVKLDAPAWNPAPLAKTARFWFRRLICETAVHRWDAQMAAGAVEPIDGKVAAEGIEEVFDAFIPMGRRRDETAVTGVVHLFAQDIDREWFVRMREGRESLLDPDSVNVDSTTVQVGVSGSSSDLYLALWERVPANVLAVAGDEGLFKAVRIS